MVSVRSAIVVGAGPAGLSCAYWLTKNGIETTLLERSSSLRRGGIAIDIRGAAIDVSREMGIWDEVLVRSTHLKTMFLLRERGRSTIRVDLSSIPKKSTEQIELFRGDLVGLLRSRLPESCELRFDQKVKEIRSEGRGVQVRLESGELLHADVLIGADGQRSQIRRLSGLDNPLRHLGAWVGVYTLENRFGIGDAVELYSRPGRLLSLFTTPSNQEVIVAFLYRDSESDAKELSGQQRIREVFSDYGHRTPQLLGSIPNDDDLYFDSISQVKIQHWSTSSRVILLGDAAWGPSLLSGQGTSMAMVGAYVLAQELSKHHDLESATTDYERRMRPFVEKNQALANVGLGVVLPSSRIFIALRNQAMRAAPLFARLNDGLDRRVLKAANHIRLDISSVPSSR